MQTKEEALNRLSRSAFRRRFRLDAADRAYIEAKGWETVRKHTADFVRTKLAPAYPVNDGKQTPMRGHPAFRAMHGCACCCRDCLNKWYRVPKGVPLSESQQERITALLMYWMHAQYDGPNGPGSAEGGDRG